MKKDMPLWLSEDPHWRIEEWIALKMWFAFWVLASCDFAIAVVERARSEIMDKRLGKFILTTSRLISDEK